MNEDEEDTDDAKAIKAESYLIITSMAMVGDMDPVVFGVVQKADAKTITIEAGSGKPIVFLRQSLRLWMAAREFRSVKMQKLHIWEVCRMERRSG